MLISANHVKRTALLPSPPCIPHDPIAPRFRYTLRRVLIQVVRLYDISRKYALRPLEEMNRRDLLQLRRVVDSEDMDYLSVPHLRKTDFRIGASWGEDGVLVCAGEYGKYDSLINQKSLI